jgi:hypothetical protein
MVNLDKTIPYLTGKISRIHLVCMNIEHSADHDQTSLVVRQTAGMMIWSSYTDVYMYWFNAYLIISLNMYLG